MIQLSSKWINMLFKAPETGMGYHVVTVILQDGAERHLAVVVDGLLTQVWGHKDIPFTEGDIQDIVVTHGKWKFEQA